VSPGQGPVWTGGALSGRERVVGDQDVLKRRATQLYYKSRIDSYGTAPIQSVGLNKLDEIPALNDGFVGKQRIMA
jgi:hypothetical protein